MANITKLLETIKSAVYGRDMRSALHDSIKAVNDDVETKEPKITEGTTSQYWRGDKKFIDFGTSVRNTILTGLSTATNLAISASDNILAALGKLQAQISNRLKLTGGTMTGDINMGANKVSSTAIPTNDADYVNKKYVDVVDNELRDSIDDEIAARTGGDSDLQRNFNEEVSNLQSADNTLQRNIDSEAYARTVADNALSERVTVIEGKAHTHANKAVLDGITETDIANWNGIKEQVTQTQLDAVKAYLEDMCFGFSDEFQRIYNAIGVTVYDGGIFGMEQNDIPLDGGSFEDDSLEAFDCGEF